MTRGYIVLLISAAVSIVSARAAADPSVNAEMVSDSLTAVVDTAMVESATEIADSVDIDLSMALWNNEVLSDEKYYGKPTIYDYPYSRTLSMPDWKRLWTNTGVLVGGGITTMIVLEALPSDATAWNKSENAKVPMFKRYWRNIKAGPHWDGDNPIFNYVLHPYAGAAYYMGARSAGFNCWGSFVYSFCISTFFWEYGFEAFNEVPSVQDLIITPVVGAILGEGFYLIKRKIVSDGYRLWGSKVLGYSVAFLVDPLNEVVGYFRGDQRKSVRRKSARESFNSSAWVIPSEGGVQGGISITYNF